MELVGFLVAWVVVANLAGWLAVERGRNMVPWLVLGLVTGPVAVLAVGLADRRASGQYKPCPECDEAIRVRATRCPACQVDLLETLPD